MTEPVFFDYARYYDLLYEDKDYVGEAAYVQGLLKRHGTPKGALLELGCGTGGHAVPLARLGYSVKGYDSSHHMITEAKARIPHELQECLEFAIGDVRRLDAGRQFDAVVSLFHVASYQIDDEGIAGMFATAARHLRPGGPFLFDFWYGPAVLTQRPNVRIKRFQSSGAEIVRIAEPIEYPNTNRVDVNYTIFSRDETNATFHRLRETHQMRYFFLPELRQMLTRAGFNVASEFEWLTNQVLGHSTWSGVIIAIRGTST